MESTALEIALANYKAKITELKEKRPCVKVLEIPKVPQQQASKSKRGFVQTLSVEINGETFERKQFIPAKKKAKCVLDKLCKSKK